MPRWRATNEKSRATPRAFSLSTSLVRMARMRSRMPASSVSHSWRRAGLDSTAATTDAPCVGGLE
jgi:hypothetical protein